MENKDQIDLSQIDKILEENGKTQVSVIPILQAIQEKYNYLPQESLDYVVENSEITAASITGVASFYSQFRLKPAGKHSVKVCIGTACHVMGAQDIYEAFKNHLGIPGEEDTDKDKLFTVEKVACLGCCMLAPAVQIDDLTYGFVKPSTVSSVLTDFLSSESLSTSGFRPVDEGQKIAGEVRTCLCSSCSASGSQKIYQEIQNQIARHNLIVKIKNVGCTGMAYQAPLIEIKMADGNVFHYGKVKQEDIQSILLRHFQPGSVLKRGSAAINSLLEKLYTDEASQPVTRYSIDIRNGIDSNYKAPQYHLVTEHCGHLEPLNIDEYKKFDGFKALEICLNQLTPEQIISQVEESGLRGRGGGGFPTATKWSRVASQKNDIKYLICNGDEGDPGAFMDRMILESFPYRVIEGMLIASYVLGVKDGYFYIRAEYPLALKNIKTAIKNCEKLGILGKNILGCGHDFNLHVVAGAGAFVCGEETALIAAIEGKRGMPHLRPPFPAVKGLWNKPTLVNNVETYAKIPWIIRKGAKNFAGMGTHQSRGTKTFALAGKIKRSGLIEVPMGTTIRQVVEKIGGGIPNNKKFKAVQIGGPSGGCVPHWLADTPIDYNALQSAGAIMGSGGLVVLDEDDCMVDIAHYFMTFTQNESCGKCTFCRIGTKRMLEIMTRLCNGQGRKGDIEKLEELAESITQGSLCGLGKTAPNPVISTINHFRDEYEAHINGKCPAGKCKALIKFKITDDCIGCTKCAQRCATKAIEIIPFEQHEIDQEKCVQCGSCKDICPVDAVVVE